MIPARPLKRLLGTPTAWLIGLGVAIGSGIFRTPGEIAQELHAPWLILLAWAAGGGVALMQGLVTAELASRFPRAGGEYVFLKEAYGEFAAFFFGWAYTIFIIGGGAAAIALALGDFACGLLALDAGKSGFIAAAAIVVVTIVNSLGLRAGAGAQNVLTVLKIVALAVIVVLGFALGSAPLHSPPATAPATTESLFVTSFAAALLSALWAYDGTTDSVKMAEEIKDARRALPRAIIGGTLVLILLYVLVNVALLRVIPAAQMAGQKSAPGEAMGRLFGPTGRNTMLIVAILVCLSSLSSTVLATIRVTFALARDGLTFRFMARLSARQAPVLALIVVCGFATTLVLMRGFREALGIYFFVSFILFGLSYASLIVFRLRERRFPENVFRCPLGPVLAVALILLQLGLAVGIAFRQPWDVLYTTLLLLGIVVLYGVWKVVGARSRGSKPGGAAR